jgi:hypothetical protein
MERPRLGAAVRATVDDAQMAAGVAGIGSVVVGPADNFGKAPFPEISCFTLYAPMVLILVVQPVRAGSVVSTGASEGRLVFCPPRCSTMSCAEHPSCL